MQLFLIRHAIAAERRPGHPDDVRALTARGRRRWVRAVQGLEALGVRFDRLFHSPWRRAVQTAELASPLLVGERVMTLHLAALPRLPLLATLAEGDPGCIGVVGHEPWLTQLLAWLTLADAQAGSSFELKKGGVAHLEGPLAPGKMKLRALYLPNVLRSID